MIPGWREGVRDVEVAFALVDIARAAQKVLGHPTVGNMNDLAIAVARWEQLTNQEGAVT